MSISFAVCQAVPEHAFEVGPFSLSLDGEVVLFLRHLHRSSFFQHRLRLRLPLDLFRLLPSPLALGLLPSAAGTDGVPLGLLVSGTLLQRSKTRDLLLFLNLNQLLFPFVRRLTFLEQFTSQYKY